MIIIVLCGLGLLVAIAVIVGVLHARHGPGLSAAPTRPSTLRGDQGSLAHAGSHSGLRGLTGD